MNSALTGLNSTLTSIEHDHSVENKEGLTFYQWLSAANRFGKYDSRGGGSTVLTPDEEIELRQAWSLGEDPTEYAVRD